MSNDKIALNANSVLVKLFTSVGGITRRKLKEDEDKQGRAVETTRETLTRVNDAPEAEKAKKLAGLLRATVDKYTVSVLNLTLGDAADLPKLREDIAPIQADIDAHNATARFHKIDRALICAPIALNVDRAALTEVLREVTAELTAAEAFFDAAKLAPDTTLEAWQAPLDNWRKRTKGLDKLFPNVLGDCLKDALESAGDLRKRVSDLTRANLKAGQTDASALKGALTTVASVPGALGKLETAHGLCAVTSAEAKDDSDAAAAGGGAGVEVH